MGVPIQEHEIVPGLVYRHHPDHRNGTANKSQWTITEPDERDTFRNAESRMWLLEDRGWGLHTPNGRAEFLGVSHDSHDLNRQLFIAKFVASARPVVWHGYPA